MVAIALYILVVVRSLPFCVIDSRASSIDFREAEDGVIKGRCRITYEQVMSQGKLDPWMAGGDGLITHGITRERELQVSARHRGDDKAPRAC
jgi:hypothetical protein